MIRGVSQDPVTQPTITAWVVECSLGVIEDRWGMMIEGSGRLSVIGGVMVGPDDPELGGIPADGELGPEDESAEPKVE